MFALLACSPGPTDSATVRDSTLGLTDPWALGLVGDPALGAELFLPRCAACHGEDGRGQLGPDLAQRVPILDDLDLYRVITRGSGGMPAINVEPQEGVDLVAYLRTSFATY